MWSTITTTEKKKQAVVVTLTLPVDGQKLAMQITSELEKEDGLDLLLKKLDELYELNKDQKIYAAYEAFEQVKRPHDMPLVKFIAAFEERINELTSVGITLPDSLLAFRLLKSANVDEESRRVVRATCTDLKLAEMKRALLCVFEASFEFSKATNYGAPSTSAGPQFEPMASSQIKSEPVYQTRSFDQVMTETNDTFEVSSSFNSRGGNRSRGRASNRSRGNGSRFQPYSNSDGSNSWRSNDRGGFNYRESSTDDRRQPVN